MKPRAVDICNRQNPKCKDKCASDLGLGVCSHTTKEEYALNGACNDPENHPERFELYMGSYWEKKKTDAV